MPCRSEKVELNLPRASAGTTLGLLSDPGEAACSSETYSSFRTTQCHSPEYCTRHSHQHESLKSNICATLSTVSSISDMHNILGDWLLPTAGHWLSLHWQIYFNWLVFTVSRYGLFDVSGLYPTYARAQNSFLKRWLSQGKFCYPQWYTNHESEDWQVQLSMDCEPQGQPGISETLKKFIFGRNKIKGSFQSMGTKSGTKIGWEIRQTSLNDSPLSHSRTMRSPFTVKLIYFLY